MGNKFSTASKERLATCHPELQILHNFAIEDAPEDYGIACGFRGEAEQNKAYNEGKSMALWGQSKHNHMEGGGPCSRATDIYIWDHATKSPI